MAEHATPAVQLRTLHDDVLLVILSDTHIGGSPGQEIFESPEELTTLFEQLAAHTGAVELVLAGDFFDFLRISDVPQGTNRAALTIERPEYRAMFAALKHVAEAKAHHVIYLPGNHDAEVWWNHDIQTTLREAGLIHEFAYSYAAHFASAPKQIVYCEHGNQFDPANAFSDYNNPLDTPLGDHVVTDILRRIVPQGNVTRYLSMRELNNVFPIAKIPQWMSSQLFYELFDQAIRYFVLPIAGAYLLFRGVVLAFTTLQPDLATVQRLLVEVAYDTLLLVAAFSLFFVAVRRIVTRFVASTSGEAGQNASAKDSPAQIATLLATNNSPPMDQALDGQQISIFISGHTHAPSFQVIERANTTPAISINSGCWLRQLQPVSAHLHGPPVFVATHVLTHVRVVRNHSGVRAELWKQPKPTTQRLPWLERLATAGRRPQQPPADAPPLVIAAGELPFE